MSIKNPQNEDISIKITRIAGLIADLPNLLLVRHLEENQMVLIKSFLGLTWISKPSLR